MYSFLESRNLIVNQQSGFRATRSTADNLLFITQKIKEAFNRGKKSVESSSTYQKLLIVIHLGVPKYLIKFIKERFLEIGASKSK